MIGLIFFGALILCAVAGFLFVRFVVRMVPNPKWKDPVMVGLTLVLLAAPFVDELIGKYQFEALCKANGIKSADLSKARGKRVKVTYGERQLVSGVIMPIMESNVLFRDADSDEVLIQHKNYYAMGGWLMRFTPLSMGSNHPMLFVGGCPIDYVDRDAIFLKKKITLIN